jgi:hypothetical protein
MEGNYGLLNCLEVGTYFGYSSTGYTFGWLDLQEHRSHLLNYGAQANFHPISLFSTANSSRWDIWLSYKLGYAHHLGVVKQSHFGGYKQSFSENGFGAGLAFFPFKREKLGFHFEYNTGNWQLKQKGFREQKRNNDFRWGMSYKFSK